MNEIKVRYTPGRKLDARVYYPADTTKIWNVLTNQFDIINPNSLPTYSNYIIPLFDTGTGMYQGDFPPVPPPFARYPVLISQRIVSNTPAWSDPEVGSGIVEWNGYQEVGAVIIELTSYTTIADADAYFSTKLYADRWGQSNDTKKQQALNQASQIIDMFRYKGTKTSALQTHEFPRSGLENIDSTLLPKDIEYAQYEIAIALLKGYDPERMAMSQNVTSRGFGAVRTTYDPRLNSEWLSNGVPSMTAWAYLLPYFNRDDSGSIKLHRVS